MSTTWLQEKEAVANNLGKTDGATYNVKREDALNRARRKFHSEKQWTWLSKVGATLSFSSQLATLPSDYNFSFEPVCVYSYSGNSKYEYRQVEWSDLAAYGTSDYVYAVDRANKQLKSSTAASSLSLDYTYLPADKTAADGSQDADLEPAPDTTAIELLATAYFFMSSRQSAGKYAQFSDAYERELERQKQRDALASLPLFYKDLRRNLRTGYRSRWYS